MIQIEVFEYIARLVNENPYQAGFYGMAIGLVGVAGLTVGYLREMRKERR